VLVIEKSKVHDPEKAADLSHDVEEASKSLQRTNKAFSVMYLGLEKTSDITTMARAKDCCDLENESSVSTEQETSHEVMVVYQESA